MLRGKKHFQENKKKELLLILKLKLTDIKLEGATRKSHLITVALLLLKESVI